MPVMIGIYELNHGRNYVFVSMAPSNILIVLSSHDQLGSTGKKTGWYLVHNNTYSLPFTPRTAILMDQSLNLPIRTMCSRLTSI